MAEDGDTILVRRGTYDDEPVVINKDITIRGDGDRDQIVVAVSAEMAVNATERDFDPELPRAFLFRASDATLENLTLRGDSSGIVVFGGTPTLRELFFDGTGHVFGIDPGDTVPSGLSFIEGSTAIIEDSVLSDTHVSVETGASPTIRRTTFKDNSGIWIQGSGVDPIIRDNIFEASQGDANVIWGGARPVVEGNTISGHQTAIQIQDGGWQIPDTGTDAVVRNNTSVGSRAAAISVSPGAAATITDNVLLDNGVGINAGSDTVIKGDRVERGGIGIVLVGGSPSLVDNVIEGVTAQGILVGKDTSPTLSGNTSCLNGENFKIVDGATPDIDATNEICPDAPAEATE